VLLEHQAIADAAVVGITIHGEELPRAYVLLQPAQVGKINERAVQDFVSQQVSRHKRLVGGVKFVETIPKLASGKIVRKVIKEWAKEDAKLLASTVAARL
jgi:4-coumarate--CoA ligase